MFSLAKLMRMATYRQDLFAAMKRILMRSVVVVYGDPPSTATRFVSDFLHHTILRTTSGASARSCASRSEAAESRERRARRIFVQCTGVMMGYVGADGKIYILVGARAR